MELGRTSYLQGDHARARSYFGAVPGAIPGTGKTGRGWPSHSAVWEMWPGARGTTIGRDRSTDRAWPSRQKLDDEAGVAWALIGLGELALAQEDYPEAHVRCKRSLALFQASGDRWGIAESLEGLAEAERGLGDLEGARRHLARSLELWRESGDRIGTVRCLEVAGMVTATGGNVGSAAKLWGAAEAIREGTQSPASPDRRSRLEPALEHARDLLGDRTFQTHWEEGRGMPVGRALDLCAAALRGEEQPARDPP